MPLFIYKMVLGYFGLEWSSVAAEKLKNMEATKTTDIGEMFKTSTGYIKDSALWKKLAEAVVDRAAGADEAAHTAHAATYRIKDVLGSIPGKIGEKINKLCGTDKNTCTQVISEHKLLALVVAGITLSTYLYIKFKGTADEKEKLEKRLRQVERQMSKSRRSSRRSDESSDKSKSDDSSSTSSSTRRRRSSNRKSVRRR